MILDVKKALASKQYEYCFSTVLHPCYKQGLRISTASCGLRKTDWDISQYPVLKSIALIVAVHHKFTSPVFFLDEFLCNVAARKQQITTKCRYYSIVHHTV